MTALPAQRGFLDDELFQLTLAAVTRGEAVRTGCNRPKSAARLDCVIFRLPDVQTGATSRHRIAGHCGNCNSCITVWKRGSLRKGSMSGSAFVYTNPGSRSRMAFSSHSKAALRSPH
jgi:hypothetical protein